MTMRKIGQAACLLAMVLLTGCGQTKGSNFPIPAPGELVLGTTTLPQALAKFGPPEQQQSRNTDLRTLAAGRAAWDMPLVNSPGTLTTLHYRYQETVPFGPFTTKALAMDFWNDTLAGTYFTSYHTRIPNRFDEDAALRIDKATATRTSIIAALGEPNGRIGFPLSRRPGWETLVWRNRQHDPVRQVEKNVEFIVDLNEEGRIADLVFTSKEEAVPMPASPNPIVIYVPAVRGR